MSRHILYSICSDKETRTLKIVDDKGMFGLILDILLFGFDSLSFQYNKKFFTSPETVVKSPPPDFRNCLTYFFGINFKE